MSEVLLASKRSLRLLPIALLALLLWAAPAYADNAECVTCHDAGGAWAGPIATADFTPAAVDRTRCNACHWIGSHPNHYTRSVCSGCHTGWPTRGPLYVSTYVDPRGFGIFWTPASADSDAAKLHAIHNRGSWPAKLSANHPACASCHAPVACDACHADAAAHAPHADAAYAPVSGRVATGAPPGSLDGRGSLLAGTSVRGPDLSAAAAQSCVREECHSVVGRSERYARSDESSASYAGVWNAVADPLSAGGAIRESNRVGDTASYTFTGTGVAWIGRKSLYGGWAQVTLDGEAVATVNTQAQWKTPYPGQRLYEASGLDAGEHTLAIRILPNPTRYREKYTYVSVDAFEVLEGAAPSGQIARPCAGCHADREAVHGYEAAPHTSSEPCTEECHQGDLDPTHRAKGHDCGTCHLSGDGDVRASITGGDAGCAGCHDGGHALDKAFCLTCHEPALRTYPGGAVASVNRHMAIESSTKALTTYPGTTQAPTACTNCHDSHGPSERAAGNELCVACHDGEGTTKPAGYSYRGEVAYAASGHAMVSGDVAFAEVSSGSEGFAAWEGATQPTPSAPGNPVAEDRLAALRSIDGANLITHLAGATGAYDYQMYRFLIKQPAEDVSSLELTWRGHGEELPDNPVALSVWDTVAGTWQPIRSAQTADPTTVRFTLDTARHLNESGHVYVMSSARNSRDSDIVSQPVLTRLSDSSVMVKWATAGPCDSWIDYGPTTEYGMSAGTSSRTTAHEVVISGLTPGFHHYRVRSASRDGDAYVSSDYPLGLPGPTLTAVPDAEISGPITVNFSWAPPTEAGRPYQYRFDLYSSGTLYSSQMSEDVTGTTRVLDVGTYSWRVEAIDSAGNSYGYSNTDTFDLWAPGGSCPFLFTWDGDGFAFEADLNTTGMLGSKNASGYFLPDPRDRYVLTHEPEVRDGEYELRIVEERLEVDYTDEFKLFAVDVPDSVDLFAEKGERGKLTPLPPGGLHTVSDLRAPLSVVRADTGEDVTDLVADNDGRYVQLNEDANVGFDYQTLEIDLGDVSDASQVKIVMDAESQRPSTPEGLARQRMFQEHTRLEVQDVSGEWRAVPLSEASLPNAMEFARSYVFDIGPAMHDTTGRVRFTYLFKTYIDMIRLDTSEDLPLEVKEMPLRSAQLSYHGFDQRLGEGDIHTYAYGVPGGNRPFMPGSYTKYGDVTPLLAATDDQFAIWGPGDEIAMRFGAIAPPEEGMRREYLTFIDGYYKSQKSAVSQTVEPLPFAAMSSYPYPAEEHYPDDVAHEAYRAEWNTRVVEGAADGGEVATVAMMTTAAEEERTPILARVVSAVRGSWERAVAAWRARQSSAARARRAEAARSRELHRSLNTDYVGISVGAGSSALEGSCLACHAVHGQTVDGSPTKGSVWANEARVCTADGTGCHTLATSSSSGISIRERFTASTDPRRHHDVYPSDQLATGARIACSDCHNPHADKKGVQIADPDDPSVPVEPDFSRFVDGSGDVYVLVGAEHDAVGPVLGGAAIDGAIDWRAPTATWTTNEPATTWVDWGLTISYEGGSVGDDTLATAHSASFPAVIEGATYHYRIRSRDALGNETVSGDFVYYAFAPPPAPTLVPVLDSEFFTWDGLACTFSWSAVASPDGDPVEYELVLDGLSYGWQSEPTKVITVYGGTHRWRVRARDAAHPSAGGLYSAEDVFTVLDSSGSCPFLFVWNGEEFAFEADLNTTGMLGSKNPTGYFKPDPRDRYVTKTEPQAIDGKYEMRLVEERREVDYTDEFKLYAVDLPAGVDLFAEKGERGKLTPLPPGGLHTVTDLRPPLSVVRTDTGADVTADVADDDGVYVQLNDDNNVGFEHKTLEIDLGDVSGAPQVKIVMDAETQRPNTAEGLARQRMFAEHTILEVQDISGAWRRVPETEATLPNAMEFARSYVFDIGPAMHDTTGKVRFTFLFKTYIDMIRLDASADMPVEVKEVPLSSAELSYHGLDQHSNPGDIYTYLYGVPGGSHEFPPGAYTRYGDVTPLLAGTDDKFVVWGPGDQLALRFEPIEPPAAGMRREYVTFIDGYYKSPKSAVALEVEPLPFAAMSTYPYPAGEQYPDDAEHRAYRTSWNTRVVEAEPETAATAGAVTESPVASLRSVIGRAWKKLVALARPARVTKGKRAKTRLGAPHYSVNTDQLTVSGVRTNDSRLVKTAVQGWGSDGSAVPPTPLSPGSEVSSEDLAKLGQADGSYWITDSATADRSWNWQVARFSLDAADIGAMNDFQVSWRGHGEPTAGYATKLAVWDADAGEWVWLHTRLAQGTDVTLGYVAGGTPSSYCLSCHDGSPPPGVAVPASVTNIGATWGTGAGADMHGARAGGTGTIGAPYTAGMSVPCSSCHDPHGNGNLYHVSENANVRTGIVATSGNSMQQLCVACHAGTVAQWHAGCLDCHANPSSHGDAGVNSPEVNGADGYPNASSDCTLCHNHGSTSYVGSDNGRGVDESARACSEHYCHDYTTTF